MTVIAECGFRFKFRHLNRRNMKPHQFALLVKDANRTGQISTHRTKIFKDIMSANIVTICMALNDKNEVVAQGYSFCRGDAFDRKDGRWRAENRLRAQLNLKLIPCPKDLRRRQTEAAKAAAKVKDREDGLARQKAFWDARAEQQVSE